MNELFTSVLVFLVTVIVTSLWNFYIKGYLVKKGEFEQIVEDQGKILDHLEASTLVAETVKDNINRQFLSNEKLWDVKKDAYDNIWKNVLELEDLVLERLKVTEMYFEAFCNHGGWTGPSDYMPDEEVEKFYKFAEEDIERQQAEFKKYKSEKYLMEQKKAELQFKEKIERLVTNLKYSSIYMSQDIIKIINFLDSAHKEQFKDKSFTYENSEEGALDEREWFEHVIYEYEGFIRELKIKKEEIIELCKKELHL